MNIRVKSFSGNPKMMFPPVESCVNWLMYSQLALEDVDRRP